MNGCKTEEPLLIMNTFPQPLPAKKVTIIFYQNIN